jgi:hypothetical protein
VFFDAQRQAQPTSTDGAKFGWSALLGRAAPDAANCSKLGKLERSWKITAVLADDVPAPFSNFSELLTAIPEYTRG